MAFDFLKLKKTIGDIHSQYGAAKEQLETLKRRREEVMAAPSSREDVIAILHARIDKEADAYPQRLVDSLQEYISNGKILELEWHSLYMLMPADANYGVAIGNTGTLFVRLAGVFREPIKSAIKNAIMQVKDWPAGAMTIKDKNAELAKLNTEIQSLEAELESIQKGAAKAGVFL